MSETIKLPDHWEGWEITGKIDQGSYGNVYRAKYRDSETDSAAVKIIRFPTDKLAAELAHVMPDKENRIKLCQSIVEDLCSEIQVMETLRDNIYIVKLQDYYVDFNENIPEWTIYIRMELLTPLQDYLVTHVPEEDLALQLGVDMCSALEECGEKDILHRDIKPENILVAMDGTFQLGDFGIARQMDLTTGSLTIKGTPKYMAPEVYHGEKYGTKADQYSLGIVLYWLMNRSRIPFVDPSAPMISLDANEKAIHRRMSGEQLPLPTNASQKLASVILKACAYSPEDRYDRISDMKHDLLVCAGELPDGELYAWKEKTAVAESIDKNVIPARTKQAVKRRSFGRLIGTVFTIVVVVISLFVFWFFSDSRVLASGSCGNALKWAFTGDGVMTISGKGMMDSYEILHPSPWRILEVTPKTSMTEVHIEEGVSGVGSYAFRMGAMIDNMQLPESLEYIGDHAFSQCWSIPSVTFGKNVSYVGQGVFEFCLNLKTITVDADNKVYDSRDFCNAVIETTTGTLIAGCRATVIPEGVTAIGPYAFSGITTLTELYIPDSVEYIDDTAFENCEDLVLCGAAGSVAEEYAASHGIEFRKE